MCFVWISEETAIISLYSSKLSVFITEAESVYCAVRSGSLNYTDTISYLKGWSRCSHPEWLGNFRYLVKYSCIVKKIMILLLLCKMAPRRRWKFPLKLWQHTWYPDGDSKQNQNELYDLNKTKKKIFFITLITLKMLIKFYAVR